MGRIILIDEEVKIVIPQPTPLYASSSLFKDVWDWWVSLWN